MNPDWDGVMKSRAREPGPLRQSLMAPSQRDAVQNLRAERDALAARVRELEELLGLALSLLRSGEQLHDTGTCADCDRLRAALASPQRSAP